MIVTVTPNPAIDVTYRVDELHRGQVTRVRQVTERAGGKGINVARVLAQLGENVTATGFAGGPTGTALVELLSDSGLKVALIDALPDVRRTVVAHEPDGTATSLWEPGRAPENPSTAMRDLVDQLSALLADARAVVIAGSLPPSVNPDLPARLARVVTGAGVPAIIDADGDPLRIAARDGAAMLAPNRDEFAALIDGPVNAPSKALAAARTFMPPAGRTPAVLLTLGASGAVIVRPDQAWHAVPPQTLEGNATGAGDAATAAIARHLAAAGSYDAVNWPAALADAVALSAAAVRRPVAGEVDVAAFERWRGEIAVEAV